MIKLRDVSKAYRLGKGEKLVLDRIDLEIPSNGVTAIFGANGSGKSTLLHMIAGLSDPTSGSIEFTPTKPRIAYAFQDFRNSLLPWRTLKANLLLPSQWNCAERSDLEGRLDALLAAFGVDLPLNRYPHEVSGGQAQMTCLLRALLYDADLYLLDEPTAALDYRLQWATIVELQRFWTSRAAAVLLVSHDLEQELLLADRIVVLDSQPGRVAEVIDVPLPRPRTLEATTTPMFVELKHHVLSRFAADVPPR